MNKFEEKVCSLGLEDLKHVRDNAAIGYVDPEFKVPVCKTQEEFDTLIEAVTWRIERLENIIEEVADKALQDSLSPLRVSDKPLDD